MTKKTALTSAFVFAVLMTIFYLFQHGFLYGIADGICSGIFFGVFMYLLYNSQWFKRKIDVQTDNQGPVIYDGGANHFLNGEAVGGKLFLMNDKLRFKSHRFNIQNHELVMNMAHVKQVSFYNLAGIIANGLEITLDNGKTEKFVVNKRDVWKDMIEKVISPLTP
jgi:hypothetical protein